MKIRALYPRKSSPRWAKYAAERDLLSADEGIPPIWRSSPAWSDAERGFLMMHVRHAGMEFQRQNGIAANRR